MSGTIKISPSILSADFSKLGEEIISSPNLLKSADSIDGEILIELFIIVYL